MAERNLRNINDNYPVLSRDLVQAEWNPTQKRAYVTKCKGKFMQNAGEIINGKTILYPEETLFLMETSVLELHFDGAIQSIQEAYRLLLGEEMALEKFQVYSHLKRIGYIVVRHKKRSDDSPQTEHRREAKDVYGEPSRKNVHLRQQISQAMQKYSNKNEYYIDDHIDEKERYPKFEDSTEVDSKNKTNSCLRCLWKGIAIPNIAGKRFLELEIPSLCFFPKNVCPQKRYYVIDINASKHEVEFEDYSNCHEYYEHNVCNNDSTIECSENQTYLSDPQSYNNYVDSNTFNKSYNSRESENLNPDQFNNVGQDVHHFNQTVDESNQHNMQFTNYENTTLDSFPGNAKMQNQPYNINQHHTQDYVHNVHDNWNNTNKHLGDREHLNNTQTRTCDMPLSTETYSFSTPYNKADQSQFENHEHNISHTLDHNRKPSSNFENTNNCTSYAENRKQEMSDCEKNNSSFNQYQQSYEANRNYMNNSNCKVSSSDNKYQHCYSGNDGNPELTQFQNVNQNYCPSASYTSGNYRISAENNENADATSSFAKCGEELGSNYEMCDSSYVHNSTSDQYGKSYEINQNYAQNPNDSVNLTENIEKSYDDTNKESLHIEETSKRQTYKQRYVNRRNKSFKGKYTDESKRRKGKRDKSPENSSPFPRVSKIVTCWEEFKHEADLQSTAEYLMNGPAKILWNNKITPLVAPSEHLTKESVFGALSVIKIGDDKERCISQPSPYDKLDFDVYLPTTNYSRCDPGPPSHSIKVVRCKDSTPSMGCEEKIPVHYAMVDNGTITYYSFSNVKLPSYI